jgi:hypothetical protein
MDGQKGRMLRNGVDGIHYLPGRLCPWQDAIGGFGHYCGKGTARNETEERDCLVPG